MGILVRLPPRPVRLGRPKWYDREQATYTTVIDTRHSVSSAYQFIKVPAGIWIDEKGVRPSLHGTATK